MKERVAFSPGEFAALFGRSQTWGYRQIYAGKVKAITEYGRFKIPASEVEKVLASAARYKGNKKPEGAKPKSTPTKEELQSAWRVFISERRNGKNGNGAKGSAPRSISKMSGADRKKDVLFRIAREK